MFTYYVNTGLKGRLDKTHGLSALEKNAEMLAWFGSAWFGSETK